MNERATVSIGDITGYHAHVYYDAGTKPVAAQVREGFEARFDTSPGRVRMGRWHDDPIGPHPMGSYQIAFAPDLFAEIVPWLALNRRGLTVFIHPETGDDVTDHSDYAIWLGEQREVDLAVLRD
ncbi:MAG: DOPA 4,5-dioxygenase family protein [Kiloniellales bacterium]|nr:DOPA 4,5-dioxygenase family protein [Kiloniellales bacterium]